MEGQVHFSDGRMLEGPAYRADSWLVSGSVAFETFPKWWDCFAWLWHWIMLSSWEFVILILVTVLGDQPPIKKKPWTLSHKQASLGRNTAHILPYFTATERNMFYVIPPREGREHRNVWIFPYSVWRIFSPYW